MIFDIQTDPYISHIPSRHFKMVRYYGFLS
ncbi:hypothetical protein EYY97_00030, partial [Hafnia paralvei]